MPPLIRALSLRDAALILVGAFSMHFLASVLPLAAQPVLMTAQFHQEVNNVPLLVHELPPQVDEDLNELLIPAPPEDTKPLDGENTSNTFRNTVISNVSTLPETTIVEHVPGWTIFRDIYMANGTLLILTSTPSSFPNARFMTSTGLRADNVPGNREAREPTRWDMDTISPEEAVQWWGDHPPSRRVWSVEGNTIVFNDPPQFLAHYYHFCAELLLGAWSFWTGAAHPAPPPPMHRAIFPHSSNLEWRDNPGFNRYFLRAAFPSLTLEFDVDWQDRAVATSAGTDQDVRRAWHFPYLMLTDRSAAFRGKLCGATQRTAAESVDALVPRSKLGANGTWWRPVRDAVWRFADVTMDNEASSVDEQALDGAPQASTDFEETDKIVITYISRQRGRRRLVPEDHENLVLSLEDLVQRKNAEIIIARAMGKPVGKEWEFNVVYAEDMTKDEQVRMAAHTTILLGVHGNGLSHLILMPRTNVSAVIEIFYPGGFAHDYEWTTGALGMTHFGVWNDTFFTGDLPRVNYPEGFQGESIPVYGPNVADIIERRVAGEL